MRLFYSIILYICAPFIAIRMIWMGILKNPGYLSGWGRRFGFSVPEANGKPVIWIHSVSVGEVQAAVPLTKRLLREQPGHQVILTTITPTGASLVAQRVGNHVTHSYLPYDFPHAVNLFIRKLKPVLLLVMETEIWPNLFHYCSTNGIRVLLVNARMSQRSYDGYLRVVRFTRQTLMKLDRIAAQTEADRLRFIALGAVPDKVCITGNMKFDVSVPQSIAEQAQSLRRRLSPDRPVWIAASTHEGEETIILNAHRSLLGKHPDCLLILAPRHPERFTEVSNLSGRMGYRTVSKSRMADYDTRTQVLILDSLGELMTYYAAADAAFVGGSLLPFGGHNVVEPASLGIPVVTGRHVTNFTEITQLLLAEGGAKMVSDGRDLAACIITLLDDANTRHQMGRAGREIVARNRGSTDRVMKLILENLQV